MLFASAAKILAMLATTQFLSTKENLLEASAIVELKEYSIRLDNRLMVLIMRA
jgi:hypothetical protein